MSRGHRSVRIALFCLRFLVYSAGLLAVWWWIVQPYYARLVGQLAGMALKYLAGIPLEAVRVEVDPSGVLSTKTSLVYIYEGRRYPLAVAYLIANIPPYIALVLATSGITWRRRITALAIGVGVLFVGHIAFIAVLFGMAHQIQQSPQISTAVGLFLLTLPFLLWIVLAYWERLVDLFEESAPGRQDEKENAPPV